MKTLRKPWYTQLLGSAHEEPMERTLAKLAAHFADKHPGGKLLGFVVVSPDCMLAIIDVPAHPEAEYPAELDREIMVNGGHWGSCDEGLSYFYSSASDADRAKCLTTALRCFSAETAHVLA